MGGGGGVGVKWDRPWSGHGSKRNGGDGGDGDVDGGEGGESEVWVRYSYRMLDARMAMAAMAMAAKAMAAMVAKAAPRPPDQPAGGHRMYRSVR